jgi:hypothetical protein
MVRVEPARDGKKNQKNLVRIFGLHLRSGPQLKIGFMVSIRSPVSRPGSKTQQPKTKKIKI